MGRFGHSLIRPLAYCHPEIITDMASEAAINLNATPPEERTPEDVRWVEQLSGLALSAATEANLGLMSKGSRGLPGESQQAQFN